MSFPSGDSAGAGAILWCLGWNAEGNMEAELEAQRAGILQLLL